MGAINTLIGRQENGFVGRAGPGGGTAPDADRQIQSSEREGLQTTSSGEATDLPPEFDIDPATLRTKEEISKFLASFYTWYSGYWEQYIQKFGRDGVLTISFENEDLCTAMISATDPGKVIIVQRMNQLDFSTLSYEDQIRVGQTRAFDDVKQTFGFERRVEARFGGLPLDDHIRGLVNDMRSHQGKMPEDDFVAFLEQIEMVQQQVERQEILKPLTIQKTLAGIKEAFERAASFRNIEAQDEATPYRNVISLDNGATINSGYALLVRSEKEIAALNKKILSLLASGQNMDPGEFVAQIMVLSRNISTMKEVRETEDLKQRDSLLQTYAAMQNAVNDTIKQFTGSTDEEDKSVSLCGKASYDDLSDIQKKVASMFSTLLGSDSQLHPLEQRNSLQRPLMDMIESRDGYPLAKYTNAQWNVFATQLSAIVTQLGQGTQIKMNDITTLRQTSTSQFEKAVRSISQTADLVGSISRNF